MCGSYGIIVRRMGALLVLAALFVTESAVAGVSAEEVPSVRVQYGDLMLSDPKGIASLYQRIRNAAAEVCKPVEGPQLVNRVFWKEWNYCFSHAIANAVQTVHNDKLSTYHWERIRGWKYPWVEAPATAASQ
jgi:UrcA family protein